MSVSEIQDLVDTFTLRMADGEARDICAHEAFPEANDDATQELIEIVLTVLAAQASVVSSDEDMRALYFATGHAMHVMAAWGMAIGAMSVEPFGDDFDEVPSDWE